MPPTDDELMMDGSPKFETSPPITLLDNVRAIGGCLHYLRSKAQNSKLPFLAHLIGVAAECAADMAQIGERTDG